MRKILATTALAMVMATGAHAAAHSTGFMEMAEEGQIRGSEFIGARVYAAEFEVDEVETMTASDGMLMIADAEREWNDIGEVSDVLMSRDGQIAGVLVDVGGFLGIGEKTVAVTMDQMRFVSDGEDANDYFLVINSNEETLDAAPEFHSAAMMDAEMDGETDMPQTNTMSEAPMVTPYPGDEFRVDGYDRVALGDLTASDLEGARVYGINDEDIGEIGELLLADDGTKLTGAVIDLGGFLGIGEKPVEVKLEELSIQRSQDSGIVRVYIDASEESLENLPDYDG